MPGADAAASTGAAEKILSTGTTTEGATESSQQSAVQSAAVGEVPATPAQPVDQSREKFEAVARREKFLAKQRNALRQKELELAKKEAELNAKLSSSSTAPPQRPKDPEAFLEQHGWTYDDLVQYKMNGGKVTPEMEIEGLKKQLSEMRDGTIKEKQTAEQDSLKRQQQDYEQAISDFKEEINSFVDENPESYELTKLFDSQSLIYETIDLHFKKEMAQYKELTELGEQAPKPRMLSKKEASDLVEKYIEQKLEAAFASKRWTSRQKPQDGTKIDDKSSSQAAKDVEQGFNKGAKTLSNSLNGSSSPSLNSAANRYKHEDDAMKRAMMKL